MITPFPPPKLSGGLGIPPSVARWAREAAVGASDEISVALKFGLWLAWVFIVVFYTLLVFEGGVRYGDERTLRTCSEWRLR